MLNKKPLSPYFSRYELCEGMGVSGILKPDGTFIKCYFAEHHMIVDQIPKEIENDCIYFSSRLNYSGDGMIYFGYLADEDSFILTESQEIWINKNKLNLDTQQRIDLFEIFRICL